MSGFMWHVTPIAVLVSAVAVIVPVFLGVLPALAALGGIVAGMGVGWLVGRVVVALANRAGDAR
ncbi:hypothetical protein [Amycolatopsis sp. WAC 01376]|uniref:hypothetical protein n=1 Tax=Amycolatopsis sp. WAC 01376 TaxID=2203195 RepID=UPI0013159961|nr:hypothetical protein [Amycolatopsis sp. WAC 01376]